jgi:RNA-directed DNA polymerase
MPFALAADLLARLDLRAAVAAEVDYRPPFLPDSPLESAVAAHQDEMVVLLEGLYRHGFDPSPGDLLQVPKRRGGMRPVTVVDFPSRVLYRALTELLRPTVEAADRSFLQKQRTARAPLDHPEVSYIVVSDVAAFYDFIDHGLLAEELVAQTGEAAVAETLTALLLVLMGRDFGLPQVLHPSDVLSEAFLDIAERRLLRLQRAVWRFNDDFYLAAVNWPDANLALEALDREIRRLGLTLNENKTLMLRADHYGEWIDRPEQLWRGINENVQVDLRAVSPYSEEDEPADVPDEAVLEAAAFAALQAAMPALNVEDRLEVEVNRQLALAALTAMRMIESTRGLAYVHLLLEREPQLTHRVSQYMVSVTPTHPFEIIWTYEQVINDPATYLSPWQALWLFEPLRHLEHLSESAAQWVSGYLAPNWPNPVRGRAALTLAEKRLIDETRLAELYGSVAPASAPDVVAAVAHVSAEDSSIRRGISRDSSVNHWIIDAALA